MVSISEADSRDEQSCPVCKSGLKSWREVTSSRYHVDCGACRQYHYTSQATEKLSRLDETRRAVLQAELRRQQDEGQIPLVDAKLLARLFGD